MPTLPSGQPTIRIGIWPTSAALLAIVILIVALDAVAFSMRLQGVLTSDSPIQRWLDITGEMSLQSWFSSSLLLIAAIGTSVAGFREDRRLIKIGWIVLAAGFLLMSADESISIHEHFADFLFPGLVLDGPFRFTWVVVALPLVAILAALYIPFLFALPRQNAIQLILAGLLYVGGALGLELLGAELFSHDETRPLYRYVSITEETLEMLGLVVLIHALLRLLSAAPRLEIEVR